MQMSIEILILQTSSEESILNQCTKETTPNKLHVGAPQSPNVHQKVDDLINHLHAVVSIGASHDEHEVVLDMNSGSDKQETVLETFQEETTTACEEEDRDDTECTSYSNIKTAGSDVGSDETDTEYRAIMDEWSGDDECRIECEMDTAPSDKDTVSMLEKESLIENENVETKESEACSLLKVDLVNIIDTEIDKENLDPGNQDSGVGIEIVAPKKHSDGAISTSLVADEEAVESFENHDSSVQFGSRVIRDSVCFANDLFSKIECTEESNGDDLIQDPIEVTRSNEEAEVHDNSTLDITAGNGTQENVVTDSNDIRPDGEESVSQPAETKEKAHKSICNKIDKQESKFLDSIIKDLSVITANDSTLHDKENLPQTPFTPNTSQPQRPLVSIMKKTDPIPIVTSATHSLHRTRSHAIKFCKRNKVPLSPKLISLTSFGRKPNSVSFSSVTLRSYDIILGDHPNCKFGAPISIGWEYHQCNPVPVEMYETFRGEERRKMKKLYLNSGQRRKILKQAGVTLEEMSGVINDVQLIQLQRRESAEDSGGVPFLRSGGANHCQVWSGQDGATRGWNRSSAKSRWARVVDVISTCNGRTRRRHV